MVKICSWDIGIINLAYCIINKEAENIQIEKWDIIDISGNTKRKCQTCGKNASAFCKENNVQKYFCKIHAKKHQPDEEFIKTEELIQDETCSFIFPRKKNQCTASSSFVHNQKTYCKKHMNVVIELLKKEASIQPLRKIKTTTDPLVLCGNLFSKLSQIPELLQVDEVLIENQPSIRNPKIKSISNFLFAYFVQNGIINKNITNSSISNVKFKAPSNKMKIDPDSQVELEKITTPAAKYRKTKELAERYTLKILANTPWISFLSKHVKKDDLCDAFLQGYHYIMN